MSSLDTTALRTIQQHRSVIEAVPSSKRGFVYEPAIELSVDDRRAVIDRLDPTVDVTSPTSKVQTFVTQLPTGQRSTVEARLKRIAAADHPTPFEAVTHTELAYGFSDETLTDSTLVSQAGVGVAYTALHGLLDEAGLDPHDTLPPSLAESVLPEDPQAIQQSSDGILDGDMVSVSELMTAHESLANSLRHQLKYARDCFFLRHYYDELTTELDVSDCPQLTWEQAALDIQNDTDPFASHPEATTSDGNADTSPRANSHEWLHQQYLPDHLESEETSSADDTPSSPSQTGLGQF